MNEYKYSREKIFVTIPLESVEEVKTLISKLRKIHPYEEPAIDIIPLLNEKVLSKGDNDNDRWTIYWYSNRDF